MEEEKFAVMFTTENISTLSFTLEQMMRAMNNTPDEERDDNWRKQKGSLNKVAMTINNAAQEVFKTYDGGDEHDGCWNFFNTAVTTVFMTNTDWRWLHTSLSKIFVHYESVISGMTLAVQFSMSDVLDKIKLAGEKYEESNINQTGLLQ